VLGLIGRNAGAVAEGAEAVMRQISINLAGAVHAIEPLLPAFRARGHGHIAVVASIAAFRGLPYSPGYCASKSGLRGYGESLRPLLKPHGISVSVVCPGFFDSAMSRRVSGVKPFMLTSEQAAKIVRRGLDAKRGRISFPGVMALLLRLADLLPPWMGDVIIRRYRFDIETGAIRD
jgi:NAD(P)-dependent dehydrogenase (short-subunit alcohol dehydrogenase family)